MTGYTPLARIKVIYRIEQLLRLCRVAPANYRAEWITECADGILADTLQPDALQPSELTAATQPLTAEAAEEVKQRFQETAAAGRPEPIPDGPTIAAAAPKAPRTGTGKGPARKPPQRPSQRRAATKGNP